MSSHPTPLTTLGAASVRAALNNALKDPRTEESRAYLCKNAHALLDDELLDVLSALSAADVPQRLVEELGRRLPSCTSLLLRVTEQAPRIDEHAFFELVMVTRDLLEPLYWYRLVDCVRGGPVFNALNPEPDAPLPGRCIVTTTERERREPTAVRLLDRRWDDAFCRQVGRALHPSRLWFAHEKTPGVITREDLRIAAVSANGEDSWEPQLGLLLDRVLDVTASAFRAPPVSERNAAWDTVWQAWRAAPTSSWAIDLGTLLGTGKAWRRFGHEVVERYIDLGGFPRLLLERAVGAARDDHARKAVVRAVHDVLADALVQRAANASAAGDTEKAAGLLAALACLCPGSHVSKSLDWLKKQPACVGSVVDLVETNERLFRRARRRDDARKEDVFDAFAALAEKRS